MVIDSISSGFNAPRLFRPFTKEADKPVLAPDTPPTSFPMGLVTS